MEPIESSETSAYNNTLTPGTYPKEKKLQSKHGESLKSRVITSFLLRCFIVYTYEVIPFVRYGSNNIIFKLRLHDLLL